ncbi:hypothetical protein HAX54_040800 [Datura stramonium]|uniref:Uncharacterized protein n=1 Tax=Datura stramonium TaxID=4076 RepID=A0ABS8VT12_DATST|nr:hypothetical protein [Datura stramonium]
MANEVVDLRRKKEVLGVLCKLDQEKAYNHVNQRFLDVNMLQTGFGENGSTFASLKGDNVKLSRIARECSCLVMVSPAKNEGEERKLVALWWLVGFEFMVVFIAERWVIFTKKMEKEEEEKTERKKKAGGRRRRGGKGEKGYGG